MVDPVVKKVVIIKNSLPAFSAETDTYSLRYRIVSQDKNRFSHWSPYYLINREVTPLVEGSVIILDRVVNVVWKQPQGYNISEFDVYFKINSGEWTYISSASSTQFSTLIDISSNSISVAIQLPTYPKQYSQSAAIFTSDTILI